MRFFGLCMVSIFFAAANPLWAQHRTEAGAASSELRGEERAPRLNNSRFEVGKAYFVRKSAKSRAVYTDAHKMVDMDGEYIFILKDSFDSLLNNCPKEDGKTPFENYSPYKDMSPCGDPAYGWSLAQKIKITPSKGVLRGECLCVKSLSQLGQTELKLKLSPKTPDEPPATTPSDAEMDKGRSSSQKPTPPAGVNPPASNPNTDSHGNQFSPEDTAEEKKLAAEEAERRKLLGQLNDFHPMDGKMMVRNTGALGNTTENVFFKPTHLAGMDENNEAWIYGEGYLKSASGKMKRINEDSSYLVKASDIGAFSVEFLQKELEIREEGLGKHLDFQLWTHKILPLGSTTVFRQDGDLASGTKNLAFRAVRKARGKDASGNEYFEGILFHNDPEKGWIPFKNSEGEIHSYGVRATDIDETFHPQNSRVQLSSFDIVGRFDPSKVNKCGINWSEVYKKADAPYEAFLRKLGPIAEQLAPKAGVPLDGLLAQMGYESGWGRSILPTQYNNYGGIKATKGLPKTPPIKTKEKNGTQTIYARFAKFNSVAHYMKFKIDFVAGESSRYKSCSKKPNNQSAYAWAYCLGRHGYHQDTDSAYAREVSGIANRLRRYGVKCDHLY